MKIREFEIINRYFKQPFSNLAQFQSQKVSEAPTIELGIGDDCAIIQPHNDYQIVVSTDHFIESVHFFKESKPKWIAKKALIKSLSDLMAMGALPLGFTLNLATHQTDQKWFKHFSLGLVEVAKRHQIPLIGGDLARSQGTHISIGVMGYVLNDQSLKRDQLKVGDALVLTGTIGLAGYQLNQLLKAKKQSKQKFLQKLKQIEKQDCGFHLPLHFAHAITPYAKTGIDISDGFFQDLRHLLIQSQLGACLDLSVLEANGIPNELREKTTNHRHSNSKHQKKLIRSLNRGDDYQLLFSVAPKYLKKIQQLAEYHQTQIQVVGEVTKHPMQLQLKYQGSVQENSLWDKRFSGYQHF